MVVKAGNDTNEICWRLDSFVQELLLHETQKQRTGAGLTIDGTMRIELDVSEASVGVELLTPLSPLIQETDTKPVVECGFWFEWKRESVKPKFC